MRKPARRRVAVDGTRHTVTANGGSAAAMLDDEPIELVPSRDGKRLFVVLPYEVWIVDGRTLGVQRSIELGSSRPSLAEDVDGVLWIGGHHLYRASPWSTALEKVGARLGGFVDRVALLRPGLLCGVGRHGEILWDTEANKELHRRKVRDHDIFGLLPTLDERALWCDGGESAWLINPARTSGYTQVRFPTTSSHPVSAEGIVAIGQTTRGRCILAARDGGVAWTQPDLRLSAQRFPATTGTAAAWPWSVAGDERWIYVLRERGLLHRFRVEEPKPPKKPKDDERSRLRRPTAADDDEPPPDPIASQCRLDTPASCMALWSDEQGVKLIFGGPRADGHLGRLWISDPSSLDWQDATLTSRELVPPPPETPPTPPSFVAIRNKLDAEPLLRDLRVDDVIAGDVPFWITRDHPNPADQPIAHIAADQVLVADTLLLPAMLRFADGTARPGLVLLSAAHSVTGQPVAPRCLAWGDEPRGWIPLDPPALREQKWARTDVFPLNVAIPVAPPDVPGERASLPRTWVDPDLFVALGRECKKLLKVLW